MSNDPVPEDAAEATPTDTFEAFARATGLADLFEMDEATYSNPDDIIGAEDDDGDFITFQYAERVGEEDGKVPGLVGIQTGGPSGLVLLSPLGMESLVEWLQARIQRAKEIEQ